MIFSWWFDNLYQNEPLGPSTKIVFTPVFLCFKVLCSYEKKKVSYSLAYETKGTVYQKGKGHRTYWQPERDFQALGGKKCMFYLACFILWRDSPQWICCTKVGCNHISTSEPVFVVLFTQAFQQICQLMNKAAFTWQWLRFLHSPDKIIPHSFCMRILRW